MFGQIMMTKTAFSANTSQKINTYNFTAGILFLSTLKASNNTNNRFCNSTPQTDVSVSLFISYRRVDGVEKIVR